MKSKFLINDQMVDGEIIDIEYGKFVKAIIPGMYGGRPHVYHTFRPIDKAAPVCGSDKCIILWEDGEQ